MRSAADDAESFAWLWLWTLLARGRMQGDLNNVEKDWIESLECVTTHQNAQKDKSAIIVKLGRSIETSFPRRKDEYSLFSKWIKICWDHQELVDSRKQEVTKSVVIQEAYDRLYAKFISEGVEYIEAHKSSQAI
jgi:hypothetical protein